MTENPFLPAEVSLDVREAHRVVLEILGRSERIILGRLFEDNRIYPEVMFLRASDFSEPIHGMIFDSIVAKIMTGDLADTVTLKDELRDKLDDVGGFSYLAHILLSLADDAYPVGQHAINLLEAWVRMEVMFGEPEAKCRAKRFRNHNLITMPYAEYLTTTEWQSHRSRTLSLACHRCQLCGRRDCILQAHHNTYERRGAEWPCDLIALCLPCHERFHNDDGLIALDPDLVDSLRATGKGWAKRLNKAIRSWMFLTGADPNKARVGTEREST